MSAAGTPPRNGRTKPPPLGVPQSLRRLPALALAVADLAETEKLDLGKSVVEWREGFCRIDPNHRQERLDYLNKVLVSFGENMGRLPILYTQAVVALELFCLDGLSRDAHLTVSGVQRSACKSDAEFVGTVLQNWGFSDDATRISHARRSARMWLQLHARGLPAPRSLFVLERLAPKPDRFFQYTRLVEELNGAVPSETQVREWVKKKYRDPEPSSKEVLVRVPLDWLKEFSGRLSRVATGLDNRELHDLATELAGKLGQRPREKEAPLPSIICDHSPITLEDRHENGGNFVKCTFDDLPSRWFEWIMKRCPKGGVDVTDDATTDKEKRYVVFELMGGNASKQNHVKGQIYHWAIDACAEMGVPVPELPASLADQAKRAEP